MNNHKLHKLFFLTKEIQYSSPLCYDDIFEIANKIKHENNDLNWRDRIFSSKRIYYCSLGNDSFQLEPTSQKGGHDTYAIIKVSINEQKNTILIITFFKPLSILLALVFFGAYISITILWWGIIIGLIFGLLVNYLLFKSDVYVLENDIKSVFQLTRIKRNNGSC